eukprot:13427064-Alexandrium_andersonii.AAC.1
MSASLVGSEMCIRDSFGTRKRYSCGCRAVRPQNMWNCLRRAKLELRRPGNGRGRDPPKLPQKRLPNRLQQEHLNLLTRRAGGRAGGASGGGQ